MINPIICISSSYVLNVCFFFVCQIPHFKIVFFLVLCLRLPCCWCVFHVFSVFVFVVLIQCLIVGFVIFCFVLAFVYVHILLLCFLFVRVTILCSVFLCFVIILIVLCIFIDLYVRVLLSLYVIVLFSSCCICCFYVVDACCLYFWSIVYLYMLFVYGVFLNMSSAYPPVYSRQEKSDGYHCSSVFSNFPWFVQEIL